MTFDKVGNIFTQYRSIFVHSDVFKDGSRNSTTFKTELFATISNGSAYKQWAVVFACCCGNSKAGSDTISTKL